MTAKEYALALYAALRGKPKQEVDAGVRRFAASLRSRGALRMLPRILAALPAAAHAINADRRVTVESARELSEAEIANILSTIGADPNETTVETKVDATLVGGVKIRTKNGTIDATVKGKLLRLKEAMTRAD